MRRVTRRQRAQLPIPAVLLAALVLLAVVVALGGCGAGQAGTANVVMKGLQFRPADLTIERGTTVRWTNEDQTAHTTTADAFKQGENKPGTWDSGPLNPGQSFEYKFDQAGSYPYSCGIHGYMKGVVTVR